MCILASVAACGGDAGNATGTPDPSTLTGGLTITVDGLPGNAAAAVTVTGPGGVVRTVTATETINALVAGTYSIAVAGVTAGPDQYEASPASQTANVSAGLTAHATVSYGLATGAIVISTSGLPNGAAPNVLLTGPNAFSRSVASGNTVAGLVPGAYHVAPAPIVVEDMTYAPTATTFDVVVTASPIPAPASVPYLLASGSLIVSFTGLPGGAAGIAIVSGPQGFQRSVSSGDRLQNLAPGSYIITANPVVVGSDAYGIPAPLTVVVAPSPFPVNTAVQFVLATGRLTVHVTGLPSGANAGITVTGPAGYTRAVSASQTIVGLTPGQYVVAADGVNSTSAVYGPAPASQAVTVAASTTPALASVSYAVSTGALTVAVNGLPQAVAAAISVTGPEGYSTTVSTTTTLTGLKPGSYTLTAAPAVAGTHHYSPSPTTRTVAVAAGATPSTTSFTYALASGGIALTVSGLPTNVLAAVSITGPGGYASTATATTLLLGLTPGTYTVASLLVQSGSASWAPNPASQTVVVTPSTSAIATTVNYVTATGTLAVTVNGLPIGATASVDVTGPNGYSHAVSSTSTLPGLVQGTYTVTASGFASSGTTYTPSATSQHVSVGGGSTSSVTVTYTGSAPPPPPPPSSLNLTIDGMHIQQVVQTYTGTVPIVTGRNGLLRVFVKANMANTATPAVRVRFYDGATLTNTITINAPSPSVPQAMSPGTLTSSWNYLIPSAVLQPGLRILADVDPNSTVTESSESDNNFPTSATPATIDVRAVPSFNVRLVPVLQSVNGLQGGVTAGNASSYLADTRAMYPLDNVDADVRAPFTTNADTLKSGDANGAWNQILSEINALRSADGSARYYFGIVKVNYGSGIAGLGYVPGRAAIGWDYLPSASGVMAHELGHNFGRFHAPSCGAAGADPSYPYAAGRIGSYGYDLATNTLKDTLRYDLMGYCNPSWISSYTFSAILNYRSANPIYGSTSYGDMAPRRGLLVWGRVERGKVILEPTFEVNAPPSLPQRRGPNRLQGFGPLGETLFDLPFDGEHLADHPDATAQNFAYVIPFDMMRGQEPTRVRAAIGAAQAEFRSAAAPATAADVPVAERVNARAVRIRWTGGNTRGVLVRDPSTQQILAFGRGGEAIVFTNQSSLDLVTSDGVHSSRRRIGVSSSPRSPLR
ncbi:MAG: M66 family metalloprotease [Gemmatimonadota bacterium]